MTYPSGLREWSAKPLFIGSNPIVTSIFLSSPILYFVYILKSLKDEKKYIGSTSNLERRLNEHNSGGCSSTKHRKPFTLIYCEKFNDKKLALKRENFFKTGKGRDTLKKN